MTTRVIGLPNGKQCSLGRYVASWKAVKAMAPDADVKGWQWFPVAARDVLRDLRAGMHDRINQAIPYYGRGRNWRPA